MWLGPVRRYLMPVFIHLDISGWSRRLPVWSLRSSDSRNMLRWNLCVIFIFLRNVLLSRGSMDSTMSANAALTSNCGNNSASWWHKGGSKRLIRSSPHIGTVSAICTIFIDIHLMIHTCGIQKYTIPIWEWNGKFEFRVTYINIRVLHRVIIDAVTASVPCEATSSIACQCAPSLTSLGML